MFDGGLVEADIGADDERISSSQTGTAGQHLATFDLIMFGANISIAAEGLVYDLIVDVNGKLFRTQVKTSSNFWHNSYHFNTRRCVGYSRNGTKVAYSKKDIDAFALVCLPKKTVLFFPVERFIDAPTVAIRATQFTPQQSEASFFETFGVGV